MRYDLGMAMTGVEMADLLAAFASANRADSSEAKAFVSRLTVSEHRTIQQLAMGLLVACVESWAKDEHGHDARNAATVRLCQKIVEATGDHYDRVLPYV